MWAPGTAVVVGAALLVGLAGCSVPSALGPERPDLLLVTIDTLRADHLPFHGHGRDTAPFLAKLAAEGVVFDHASAPSSWTAPSVASLVTSLYPPQHGVARSAFRDPRGGFVEPALSDGVLTLAERLRGLGYSTTAVVTNPSLSDALGYAQGFDRFQQLGLADADRIYATLHPLAVEIRQEEPFFVWIHLVDPRAPYREVAPWAEAFDVELASRVPEVRQVPRELRALQRQRASSAGLAPLLRGVDNPILLETLEVLYDSEIRNADRWLEQMVGSLGLGRDDVIAVTADHGEEFRDHGSVGHGRTLYDEVTRVPLVVWSPERLLAAARVATPVSLLDVLPTLVEAGGGEVGPEVQGTSLWPACVAGGPLPERDLPLTVSRADGEVRGLVRWPHKLLVEPTGEAALFDLSEDPAEQVDLAGARPAEAHALRAAMRAAFDDLPDAARAVAPVDAERLQELRALGYLDDGAR